MREGGRDRGVVERGWVGVFHVSFKITLSSPRIAAGIQVGLERRGRFLVVEFGREGGRTWWGRDGACVTTR